MIADDTAGFADALVRLLGDMGACQRIGEAARARAVEIYDERHVISRIAAEVAAVLEGG